MKCNGFACGLRNDETRFAYGNAVCIEFLWRHSALVEERMCAHETLVKCVDEFESRKTDATDDLGRS